MKAKIISAITIAILSLNIVCAASTRIESSKKYVTKTVKQELPAIDGIVLNCSVDVEIINGKTQKISLFGADNVLQYIKLSVINRKLVVDVKDGIQVTGRPRWKVTVESPIIASVELNGSGDVSVRGTNNTLQNILLNGSGDIDADNITTKGIAIELNGSGDVDINRLKVLDANIVLSGSGDIELNGIGENVTITTNGSGDVDAERFITRNLVIQLNGSGDVDCHADDTLTAEVNGSGEIEYSGTPVIQSTGRKSHIKKAD